MSRRLVIIAVWILVLAVWGGTAFAQGFGKKTRDGETPADEGVCDVLRDATPGLYGLCVAFCEAQDCEPDFSLADPFQNCSPPSQRILDNYNRRKTVADPDMPCILQTPCPCWTEEDLDELGQPAGAFLVQCDSSYLYRTDYEYTPHLYTQFGVSRSTNDWAMFVAYEAVGGSSCWFEDPDGSVSAQIDAEQVQACREQIKRHTALYSISCFE